jgi:phage gp45-like
MSATLEARVAALERQIDMLTRRRGSPFALGRSTLAVSDTGPVQTVQMRLDALSVADNMPVLYGFGVTGSPPIGTDMKVAFLDGDRKKGLVIASGHQTYRLRGLGVGDSALYDIRGANFWLASAGPTVNCAGNPMTINGDLHVTGAVIAGYGGADQVGLQTHGHKQGNDSHGDTEVPTDAPTAGT